MANRKGNVKPTTTSVKEPADVPVSSTRKKKRDAAADSQQENEAPTGKYAIGVFSVLF